MKKYMIADLVKDTREDLVLAAMEEYDLNRANAEIFVDNFPNQSTWADVEEVAESLGVDITDVEDDDVENYMDMGGAKGEIESSSGIIQWIYDNTLKAYVVLMMIEENALMYLIDNNMMKEWINSDSAGVYYNNNIRGNEQIESQGKSSGVPCGCGPNPCEQGKIDQFNNRYSSIL
jgi:hypothetical protein